MSDQTQIIVLSGRRTHAHDVAWYEQRRGMAIEPRVREHAAEVVPGVWAGLLGIGDHYCQEHGNARGGVLAVWDERPDSTEAAAWAGRLGLSLVDEDAEDDREGGDDDD